MTADDLPSRLLAAIAEVEQREGIKVQLGLTEPSLLLSLCMAHREIVEQWEDWQKADGSYEVKDDVLSPHIWWWRDGEVSE